MGECQTKASGSQVPLLLVQLQIAALEQVGNVDRHRRICTNSVLLHQAKKLRLCHDRWRLRHTLGKLTGSDGVHRVFRQVRIRQVLQIHRPFVLGLGACEVTPCEVGAAAVAALRNHLEAVQVEAHIRLVNLAVGRKGIEEVLANDLVELPCGLVAALLLGGPPERGHGRVVAVLGAVLPGPAPELRELGRRLCPGRSGRLHRLEHGGHVEVLGVPRAARARVGQDTLEVEALGVVHRIGRAQASLLRGLLQHHHGAERQGPLPEDRAAVDAHDPYLAQGPGLADDVLRLALVPELPAGGLRRELALVLRTERDLDLPEGLRRELLDLAVAVHAEPESRHHAGAIIHRLHKAGQLLAKVLAEVLCLEPREGKTQAQVNLLARFDGLS
mmetsp:Transcript_30968/g.88781  ORF Transcript_30968/g.88781 Transcript_30968/m.88781 type:complete len:387 (-) Transcript_30968:390-1550(-)